MNATQLLTALQSGAILHVYWKPRTIGAPKRIYELRYPDGQTERIQASASAALPFAKYRTRFRQGGNMIHYSPDSPAATIAETMQSEDI